MSIFMPCFCALGKAFVERIQVDLLRLYYLERNGDEDIKAELQDMHAKKVPSSGCEVASERDIF